MSTVAENGSPLHRSTYGPDEPPPDAPPDTLGAVGGPLNDIPDLQQSACYDCEAYLGNERRNHDIPGMTCAEQPNIRWPHIQVNTLTKVSDEYW